MNLDVVTCRPFGRAFLLCAGDLCCTVQLAASPAWLPPGLRALPGASRVLDFTSRLQPRLWVCFLLYQLERLKALWDLSSQPHRTLSSGVQDVRVQNEAKRS